jgi:hypothetical protein
LTGLIEQAEQEGQKDLSDLTEQKDLADQIEAEKQKVVEIFHLMVVKDLTTDPSNLLIKKGRVEKH